MNLATKDLGTDSVTGLNQRVVITSLDINGETEVVIISYRIETLSPTGVIVSKSIPMTFTRYNAPAILDENGDEVKAANMKWNQLRDSQLGQTILGMLQLDINDYPNLEQI